MYKAKFHPAVKKDLKKIDPPIRTIIREQHIPYLLKHPDIGDKLTGDLQGTRSYHCRIAGQQFRIAYIKDEPNKTLYVQMIAKREDFYSYLKRRFQS